MVESRRAPDAPQSGASSSERPAVSEAATPQTPAHTPGGPPPDSVDAMRAVGSHLGHAFRYPALLEQALTHRSYVHEHPDLGALDNERFEFAGDAVMGAAAALLLCERFPGAREGELTRRRADLVNERALAEMARAMSIGEGLRLGRGEERTGGRNKPRLLASALEACIAAVYFDAGVERAFDVARALLTPRVDALAPGERDFKSRLQELLQSRGEAAPRYELEKTDGPEHMRSFYVQIVTRDGRLLAKGSGRSKAEAEQDAAKAALESLSGGGQ